VQIAKALGASKVIATAGTDAKCEVAKRIGACVMRVAERHKGPRLSDRPCVRQAAPTM
jgi:NADPH:quinone reductase-like Zn-dependent oxidoreductase